MKNSTVSKAAVAGLFAIAAILGALPGCSAGNSGSQGVSGTFSGSAVGMGGSSNPVTVTLTLENGTITAVTAEGPGETEGIGSKAIDVLPGEMVAANSVTVDAVSGADMSEPDSGKSGLIKRALSMLGKEDMSSFNDVVMIGDRKFDTLGANEVGTDFIGVSYGFAPVGELEALGVQKIAASAAELEKYLFVNE